MDNLNYTKIELQSYLNDYSVNPQLGQIIFRWRTRMANFKKNFSNGNNDISCALGCDTFDSQEHILNCIAIKTNVPDAKTHYDQLFSKNVSKIKEIISVLTKAFKVRESLLETDTYP